MHACAMLTHMHVQRCWGVSGIVQLYLLLKKKPEVHLNQAQI
jgi:hypothetical protein